MRVQGPGKRVAGLADYAEKLPFHTREGTARQRICIFATYQSSRLRQRYQDMTIRLRRNVSWCKVSLGDSEIAPIDLTLERCAEQIVVKLLAKAH